MKIIGFKDIQEMQISPKICYEWVSDMILNKQDMILPPKVHMNLPENIFCNVMPGIVKGGGGLWGGVKTVTRYPQREPALDSKLLLFNAETGAILAFMDANWITTMRTGAVAAHSVLNLAKKDFSEIGMIGLGNTARATLMVLASMLEDKELSVKLLRYKNQAELFIEHFEKYSNLHFEIIDDVASLIRNSDVVISCATYFTDDICTDDCFRVGILVVPVHTRGFTNCDLFFDKVYSDDTGHVSHFGNFNKFKYYAEMCDVVNGRAVGRENDRERILAYNIGVSIHDINYAAHIFQMLCADKDRFASIEDVDMGEPKEKFWI